MTKEEIKDRCEALIEKIKLGVAKNDRDLTNFLIEYCEVRLKFAEDESRKKAKTIVRRFQRINEFKTATPKTLQLIKDIYNFLRNPEYQPLSDSSFEESVLGKEHYDRVVENILDSE